jgi:hypothetical protein
MKSKMAAEQVLKRFPSQNKKEDAFYIVEQVLNLNRDFPFLNDAFIKTTQ